MPACRSKAFLGRTVSAGALTSAHDMYLTGMNMTRPDAVIYTRSPSMMLRPHTLCVLTQG
eukprot:6205021-Pleurochrysis_carterae.AAC.1